MRGEQWEAAALKGLRGLNIGGVPAGVTPMAGIVLEFME